MGPRSRASARANSRAGAEGQPPRRCTVPACQGSERDSSSPLYRTDGPGGGGRFRHWLSRFRPTPTQTVHSERLGPEMVDRGREMLPCARRPTPQHEQRGPPRDRRGLSPMVPRALSPEPAAGSAHPPPCSWANPTQARLSPGTGPAQRPIQHRGLSSTEAYPAQRLIQQPDPLAVHRAGPCRWKAGGTCPRRRTGCLTPSRLGSHGLSEAPARPRRRPRAIRWRPRGERGQPTPCQRTPPSRPSARGGP